MSIPVSLEQAKGHWKRHTKRAYHIKPKWEDWGTTNGIPTVTTDVGTFYFYRTIGGHIFGTMNRYKDEEEGISDMDFFNKVHKPLEEEPEYYKNAKNIVHKEAENMDWESEQEKQEYLQDADRAMQETVEHDRKDREKRGFFNW